MKRLMLLVSVLLCLLLAATALADTGATLIAENLEDTEWVGGTNRLSVEGDPIKNYRAYSMNALDGTQLTEAIYANLKGDTGYVVATSLQADDLMNADGLLDVDGNVLIPCEYGDIDVLSTEWAVAISLAESTADNYDYSAWFSDAKYLIDTVDIYHLPEGNKLATFPRAEYNGARAYGHSINIENRSTGEVTAYDTSFSALGTPSGLYDDKYALEDYKIYYDGGAGIMDMDGNIILPPSYNSIYSAYQGVCRVTAMGNKKGLIDQTGNVILSAEYDDVISTYYLPAVDGETNGYIAAGYIAVEIDGKLGYVDLNGTLTCEPKYIASNMDVRGASATVADPLTGNIIMVAADGGESIVEGYERVYPLSYGSGIFYEANDSDYVYTLIDWHGNVVIPGTNGDWSIKDIELSGDGKYALVESRDSSYNRTTALYELTYPESAVATAPAANEPAAEEPAAAAGDSPVASLLTNAATLLSADSSNADKAIGLLKSAVTLLSGNDPAVSFVNSAITLLEADPAGNADSVISLLETAAATL